MSAYSTDKVMENETNQPLEQSAPSFIKREMTIASTSSAEQVRPFGDTPVRQVMEEEHAKKKINSKVRKNIMFSGEQDINLLCDNDSIDDENNDLERQIIRCPTAEQLDEDDHILVMFPGKKGVGYYVGRVLKANFYNGEVETSFMQSKLSADGRKVFALPDHEDSYSHLVKNIVIKLPWPTTGQTSRAAKTFDFQCSA